MACATLNATPNDAVTAQQDSYDALILNWGSNEQDRYPTALNADTNAAQSQPSFPFSPAAIVLGPLSTVDRCWLSWNPMVQRLIFGQSSAAPRCLSVDTPIAVATPAGSGTLAAGAHQDLEAALTASQLYAFPSIFWSRQLSDGDVSSTVLPVNYKKADGTEALFWDDTPPHSPASSSIARMLLPRLQLLFLRTAPAIAPGTKRFPLQCSELFIDDDAAEHAMVAVPTFGRRTVVVSFAGNAANLAYRVAALRCIGKFSVPQETTEQSVTVEIAGSSGKIELQNPAADYIIVYVKNPAAAAYAVQYSVVATD